MRTALGATLGEKIELVVIYWRECYFGRTKNQFSLKEIRYAKRQFHLCFFTGSSKRNL